MDDHNHRWPAEQCVHSDDPVHAADCLDARGPGLVVETNTNAAMVTLGVVDEGIDSQREFTERHDKTRTAADPDVCGTIVSVVDEIVGPVEVVGAWL